MVSALVLLAAVVRSTDGVPIHYTVQGKGEPALVFVHCWTCDRHLWDGQVPAFARDHRVVALDLAGHGESGRGRKEWSIEAFGQDVKAVADKLGLERMVLVGSSMGGPVILEAARRMPGRVVGLVPVDILKNVDDQMPPDQVHDGRRGIDPAQTPPGKVLRRKPVRCVWGMFHTVAIACCAVWVTPCAP